ncbi:MAG: glycosyltransferase family A protein [Elusimicrobiales bacterium]|jgi:hypothetical protein
MTPPITVVIPLYNKAAFIARAVKSVVNQTVQDFELMVVDDGSTDNGGDIVEEVRDRRVRLVRQNNAGVAAARNYGVALARSEIVSFLDADDEYRPEFLATILRLHEKYPSAGLCATAYSVKLPSGRELKQRYLAMPSFPWEGIIPDYFESALGAQPVSASSSAVMKAVLLEAGGFPAGEKLGEDLDTWFRIALKYPVAFSSYKGAVYNIDTVTSACGSLAEIPEFRLVETARRALKDGTVKTTSVNAVKGLIDMRLIISASYALKCGEKAKARVYLSQVSTSIFNRDKAIMKFASLVPLWLLKKILGAKERFGLYLP